jgi:glycogen debranching enzyme
VSRDWDFTKVAATEPAPKDWGYVMFGWDNLFAALLLGASTRDAAYSALIQAVRVKAAEGFVSNFEAGGQKSQDRTEPLVGARVLLELYKKYGDAWVVELLLDDFLDWFDFVWRRRVGSLGLICLGSDFVQGYDLYSPNTMQGARYESGMDNSPTYDGDFFDAVTTHHMLAADVGMSSLFVAESLVLAQLARAVNRSADAEVLEAQAASVRALIASQLWDESAGIFKNYITLNDTLSSRVSPTSFYALAAGAASDAQAARMASEWALNATRFCLSTEWPLGVSAECYWGLPSITADDPAFPALGYWRGYVWAPTAQLTWWAFEKYAHVPQMADRKSVV